MSGTWSSSHFLKLPFHSLKYSVFSSQVNSIDTSSIWVAFYNCCASFLLHDFPLVEVLGLCFHWLVGLCRFACYLLLLGFQDFALAIVGSFVPFNFSPWELGTLCLFISVDSRTCHTGLIRGPFP